MGQLETPTDIANELVSVVRTTEPAFRELADEVVGKRPAPDAWGIKEVVGHLIDSAANNHQRIVRAQFTEQLIFPKYYQNEWVICQNYLDADWQGLVDFWSAYNRHLANLIRTVPTSSLEVVCNIGPYEPVTLHFLLVDYVVHLKHHLRKIAEELKLEPSLFGG